MKGREKVKYGRRVKVTQRPDGLTLKMEKAGHEPRNAGNSRGWKMQRNRVSL